MLRSMCRALVYPEMKHGSGITRDEKSRGNRTNPMSSVYVCEMCILYADQLLWTGLCRKEILRKHATS